MLANDALAETDLAQKVLMTYISLLVYPDEIVRLGNIKRLVPRASQTTRRKRSDVA